MRTHRAFTLVELLVVVAIIGILVGMLLPAVQQIREAARRTECSNNLRQIGLALHNYHGAHRRVPAGWIADDANGEPGWGWAAISLPHLEAGNLYRQFDLDTPIDDIVHEELIKTVIPTYICPSDSAPNVMKLDYHIDGDHGHPLIRGTITHDVPPQHSHSGDLLVSRGNYSGVFGTEEIDDNPADGNGIFFENSKIRFRDVSDGLSNTLMVGERSASLGTVTWVGVSPVVEHPFARIVGSTDHTPNHSNGHFDDFSSAHPLGANFLLSDASVRLIAETIDLDVYQGIATRSGGEVVNLDD